MQNWPNLIRTPQRVQRCSSLEALIRANQDAQVKATTLLSWFLLKALASLSSYQLYQSPLKGKVTVVSSYLSLIIHLIHSAPFCSLSLLSFLHLPISLPELLRTLLSYLERSRAT